MGKFEIAVFPELCTGCLRCQLGCSELYTGAFAPSQARIRIMLEGLHCEIQFAQECNQCGVCAENCLYGALHKVRVEEVR